MDSSLSQQAVSAALFGKWDEAVSLNQKILETDGQNIDALNRLARAYAEKGILKEAITTTKMVLKLDPFNPIATKCLNRWTKLSKTRTNGAGCTMSAANVFLEEPGKTKIISLLYLGDEKLLAILSAGEEVVLSAHNHRVSLTTKDGKYIGRLPDDLSARLRSLIAKGNQYQAYIKSVDPENVKVFIREVKRVKELADVPSFPGEKLDYISFTPPELVHRDRQVVTEVEEV